MSTPNGRWRQEGRYTARLYLACILIGILGGVAALTLKTSVHSLEAFLRGISASRNLNPLLIFLPTIGILLTTFFVRRVARTDLSHGVTKVLASLSRDEGRISPAMIWQPLVACTITVGFGGSMGMEAPIMHSGSAIGSNVARLLRLDSKDRVLLVGSGCAAAVAAIFKAPVAGALFAIEILMIDLTAKAIIPLFASSVTGALLARIATGSSIEYSFAVSEAFDYRNIAFYALLGLLTGATAAYLRAATRRAAGLSRRLDRPYIKALAGGLCLAVLILFFPTLFGEGYSGLSSILSGNQTRLLDGSPFFGMDSGGWLFVLYLAALIAAKGVATALTGSAGGIGGVFAPGLFMGGAAGFTLARALRLLGFSFASENNFALVGMAGLLSALLKAPLTSVFLIAELTGGYHLLIPLLITSMTAFAFGKRLFPYSVYSEDLAAEGALITHDKDRAALGRIELEDFVERDYIALPPEAGIEELERAALGTRRLAVPILDEGGRLLGIVRFELVRRVLLSREGREGLSVCDFASAPEALLSVGMGAEAALAAFDESGAEELPYIDEGGRFSGFVERAALLAAYRRGLKALTLGGD
jgi:CIC family chloride channel protein